MPTDVDLTIGPSTILVGWNPTVLRSLEHVPDLRVIVIEEPELWDSPGMSEDRDRFTCVADVRLTGYQGGEDLSEAVADLTAIDAVLPGAEYGVEAAAALAQTIGLPGIGIVAATIFRSKQRLRAALDGSRLAAVPWATVQSPSDVATFMKHVERPVMLKPTNRQASVGVIRINSRRDVLAAWKHSTQASEPHRLASRVSDTEYLVEVAIDGTEVSVEALVRDGNVDWLNVTEKTTLSAQSPVETAHLVPGERDGWGERLTELVAATGARDGLLHSEWIYDGHDWNIIECAARPPGDFITDLIDLAYGFPVLHAWLEILRGAPPTMRSVPARHATVRYLIPETAGMFLHLHGEQEARDMPDVVAVHRTMEPGRVVDGCRSSWDRLAAVVTTGADAEAAISAADRCLSRLHPEIMATHDASGPIRTP